MFFQEYYKCSFFNLPDPCFQLQLENVSTLDACKLFNLTFKKNSLKTLLLKNVIIKNDWTTSKVD